MTTATTTQLRRILGVGFGLAMAFGGTVGVGILRLPASLAQALGDAKLIVLFWVLGGIYAILGAMTVAELAAMMPEAGGFYVYARRAFGEGPGFVVGVADWLNEVAALAYAALTASDFLASLWPPAASAPRTVASAFIIGFAALHMVGLRMSGALMRTISLAVGCMMIAVVIGCFLGAPAAPAANAVVVPLTAAGGLAAAVVALRSVFVAYDGWYSAIYTAEESTSPSTTLPKAIIGGTLAVAAIYLLINLAILRVLTIPQLAVSKLPAADAARQVLPHGGGTVVTIISILTVMSLINAMMVISPRIILAVSRDGLLAKRAASVSASGAPRVALAISALGAVALIFSGSFDQIVAVAAAMFLLTYVSAYLALLVLRRREPDAPRPYRTAGVPVTTLTVLAGCIFVWIGNLYDDPHSGLLAAVLLAACAPLYLWLRSRRANALVGGTP